MENIHIEMLDTALSAFDIYKLFHNKEYSVFLDSGMDHLRLGRYSIIGIEPFMRVEAKKNIIHIWENGLFKTISGNPFRFLRELLSRFQIKNNTHLPFVGGAIGFLSYDLCHHIEKLPQKATDDLGLADMVFGFYNIAIVFDHLKHKAYITSVNISDSYENSTRSKLEDIKNKIKKAEIEDFNILDLPFVHNEVSIISNFSKEEYCKAIEKAREYIRCGDIYQVNMTQRFTTLINRHPINIYSYLRTINPAPFAAYMNYGDMKILSSSPERFIKIRKNYVETRPIKGTMPRGCGIKDKLNKETLINSIKDKAENLMIVDLMRNDIGKVCKFGSVKVPELFKIEKYATVFQMVSTVTGELRNECDAVDCLQATFPGGSITGAPKIRSMEIIDMLEPTCRHIYTGAIGYIGFDGDMDMNIVIRTILVNGQRAYYQVGGGIVWDSKPENEYQETLDKGFALKRSLLYGSGIEGQMFCQKG
ncbi:MAG: aminodeoxychorismate synthase component I [Clostridia bacterium]|nr:aminodeoxychorismate synthase component I [Clostridia bacterium]